VAVQEGEALAHMRSDEWDPRATAFVQGSADPIPEGPLEGGAELLSHTPDRVTVRATASRAALLVLADNFSHGWRATVDGEPAEILRANHTFRGVVVPAGTSTVEFAFRPDRLRLGFFLYLGGWFVLLLCGGWMVLRRRGRGEPGPVATP
jgi:hypothetical protein